MKIGAVVLLWLCVANLNMGNANAAVPAKEKRAYEILNIPETAALEESEAAGEDLFEVLKATDLVFTAELASVSTKMTGLGQMPVPVTFMNFREIELIQGTLPPLTSFRSAKPASDYRFGANEKLLVLLSRTSKTSGELEITRMVRANKRNVDLARLAASLRKK